MGALKITWFIAGILIVSVQIQYLHVHARVEPFRCHQALLLAPHIFVNWAPGFWWCRSSSTKITQHVVYIEAGFQLTLSSQCCRMFWKKNAYLSFSNNAGHNGVHSSRPIEAIWHHRAWTTHFRHYWLVVWWHQASTELCLFSIKFSDISMHFLLPSWWSRYHQQAFSTYRQTSNISRTLVGTKIVDHPDVVGASPIGAAPTTSSFLTWYLASIDWAKATARRDENVLSFGI